MTNFPLLGWGNVHVYFPLSAFCCSFQQHESEWALTPCDKYWTCLREHLFYLDFFNELLSSAHFHCCGVVSDKTGLISNCLRRCLIPERFYRPSWIHLPYIRKRVHNKLQTAGKEGFHVQDSVSRWVSVESQKKSLVMWGAIRKLWLLEFWFRVWKSVIPAAASVLDLLNLIWSLEKVLWLFDKNIQLLFL